MCFDTVRDLNNIEQGVLSYSYKAREEETIFIITGIVVSQQRFGIVERWRT